MMKLDSKYFDSIRVNPDSRLQEEKPVLRCHWLGCKEEGAYLAPKGRGREGEYYRFCLDHVREYNRSYNYFQGMTNDEIASFQKDAMIGHRPTWRVAAGAWRSQDLAAEAERLRGVAGRLGPDADGGFGLFGSDDGASVRPTVRRAELKCLRALNLDAGASASEIKAQFKALVKLCHPDSNGGDRGSEERLREVIQAYNHLKRVGLC